MKLALDFGIDSGPPPAQDDPITDFLEGDTLDPAQKREFIDILDRKSVV